MRTIRAFDEWKIQGFIPEHVTQLERAGFTPLTARLLASRGLTEPKDAIEFLHDGLDTLSDPFIMADMDKAVERIRRAIESGERTAVYGDYDVDGLTSTCLITTYLRSKGLFCEPYIPERLTEGYGVNEEALRHFKELGVSLIITVDCGVTASAQAELARELGMDMVITDHHECSGELPVANAVVDPHRPDCPYPFKGLAGVGVAFKLVCALEGPERLSEVMEEYGDLAAMGTIADIMPMTGENRAIVRRGIAALKKKGRIGLAALMAETGVERSKINSINISFVLVPKLNAAGRMGKVRLAFDLLMSRSEAEAEMLAKELCMLNQERRSVENAVYEDALTMLSEGVDGPIILASEDWHQGVSGIVASRLAEKFGVPAIVICDVEGNGRGSCRSAYGFNIFEALDDSAELLESYGGHELAAGLTLDISNLPEFRRRMQEFYKKKEGEERKLTLFVDYEVDSASLLSIENIDALLSNEPWGGGNPPPLLCMRGVSVDSITPIGGDRHLKMRVSRDFRSIDCVFFSKTVRELGLRQGMRADIAFEVSVNEFRGSRSVQLLLKDARVSKIPADASVALATRFFNGEKLSATEREILLPDRPVFAAVWRNMVSHQGAMAGSVREIVTDLASRVGTSFGRIIICMNVFEELGLAEISRCKDNMTIYPDSTGKKVNLDDSKILRRLKTGED
ncbi:MAG: single-stranded-DNA-specific exonuclease RecJ [Oscillospiraceae bacterium]|nr:single-stranded-DNA-specific exonuclease RecJ [Oscillospiraceae bacterium]